MAAVLAVAVLAAACGGEADPGTATGSPGSSAAAGGTAGATNTPGAGGSGPASSAAAPTPAADVVEIRVTVAGGKVSPRPTVRRVRSGQTVRLTVTADEADEVHVHGYERTLKLTPGRPATLEFRAGQAGRFEVETHESSLQLLQLQVS
ncbi:MAG TPA: hypothetical protein VFU43_13035 [Streptosporangiaceae bacterium]|nr:hypothetical protein [Streptosporangiaceae bacterium]